MSQPVFLCFRNCPKKYHYNVQSVSTWAFKRQKGWSVYTEGLSCTVYTCLLQWLAACKIQSTTHKIRRPVRLTIGEKEKVVRTFVCARMDDALVSCETTVACMLPVVARKRSSAVRVWPATEHDRRSSINQNAKNKEKRKANIVLRTKETCNICVR
jgi:hypothetical protein